MANGIYLPIMLPSDVAYMRSSRPGVAPVLKRDICKTNNIHFISWRQIKDLSYSSLGMVGATVIRKPVRVSIKIVVGNDRRQLFTFQEAW